jgi:acetyl esterase/lipase
LIISATRRVTWAVLLAGACASSACGGTSPERGPAPYLDEVADQVVVHRDLTYGEGPVSVDPRLAAKLHRPGLAVDRPRRLKLDLYEPAGVAGEHPALVVVHGGGFGFGDKSLGSAVDLARTSRAGAM